MKNIAIVAKPHADNIKGLIKSVIDFLTKHGIDYLLEDRAASVMGVEPVSIDKVRELSDAAIVLGGDGTLISAIRIFDEKEIPILGVNLGRLGFLTETRIDEISTALKNMISGEYTIEKRLKLCSEIYLNGDVTFHASVINDVVINKGALARIIDIELFVNDCFVNRYRADGLIISTPTGSTAYNLAAGGPIIYPTLNNIIITPICPHSLSNRPIVLDADVCITMKVLNNDEKVFITYDGQIGKRLDKDEIIKIKRSSYYINLVVPKDRNYFSVLREKLGWGGN
ncbi:NAD(+)/NADH kinase [Calditerrivibrio sp.]|jgi:NAD+ kinase|uniref:NAD(+)/NADH kinase n=1 Tax=Calditerrivibrio sp. TaxID=2792612 RepID=UPI003D118C94